MKPVCNAIAIVLLLTGTVVAEELRVGRSAEPENWTFIGVHSYAPMHLQSQLADDFELQACGHPRGPLLEFVTKLQHRLEQGYRYCGFVDATVEVAPNVTTGEITITVEEGPRFRAGRVIFEDVPDEMSEQIAHVLTEEHVANPDAVPVYDDDGKILEWVDATGETVDLTEGHWKHDDPVRWDARRQKLMRKEVAQTLTNWGYPEAVFVLELQREGKMADLRVRIDDLGPPAVIQEIFVFGNQQHSAEEVCRFLKLEPGETLTRALRSELRRKLLDSGRFATANLASERRFAGLTLRIEAEEAPYAPHLDTELTAEAESMLRLREWLIQSLREGKDLVIEWPTHPHQPQLLLSPDGVTLAVFCDGSIVHAIDVSVNTLSLYDAARKMHFETSMGGYYQSKITLGLTTSAENLETPRKASHTFSLPFGKPSAKDGGTVLQLRTRFNPSYFLSIAYDPSITLVRQDGSLQFRGPTGDVTINPLTGELLNCITLTPDGEVESRVYVAPGARLAQLAELSKVMDSVPLQRNPKYPATEYITFLLADTLPLLLTDELLQQIDNEDQVVSRGLNTVRDLVDCGALRPIDAWFTRPRKEKQKSNAFAFRLPPSRAFSKEENFFKSGLHLSSYLYEKEAWPWTFMRQFTFMRNGDGESAIRIIRGALQSEECGPLAHWLAAEAFSHTNPQLAAQIAVDGQNRLDTASFRRDCQELILRQPDVYRTVLRRFAQLTPEEHDQIAQRWPRYAGVLAELAAIDATNADSDQIALVADALARHWEELLREQLAERLEQLAKLRRTKSKDNLFDDEIWKTENDGQSKEQKTD